MRSLGEHKPVQLPARGLDQSQKRHSNLLSFLPAGQCAPCFSALSPMLGWAFWMQLSLGHFYSSPILLLVHHLELGWHLFFSLLWGSYLEWVDTGCISPGKALSHNTQASIKLNMPLKITLNFWSFCLHLPSLGLTGIHHRSLFLWFCGLSPGLHRC